MLQPIFIIIFNENYILLGYIIKQARQLMNTNNDGADKKEKALQKVKELAKSGDQFRNNAKYSNAADCYSKVVILLVAIAKQTQSIQTIDALNKKIVKFRELAQQMKAKSNPVQPESKIQHFGFPQVKKVSLDLFKKPINNVSKVQPPKKINHKQRGQQQQKIETDADVTGILAKDIKANFSDIVGMSELKQILYEAVIIPQKRPDLFEGIRSPPRGILLYGPPGNGKTFITKALAKQSGCNLFLLSAGSILNKFVGQTEKMLRKVFENAKKFSPSIIFIDEIDSMLTARSQSDNDSARRLKTQFLIQFDNLEGAKTILIGATNLPNQLDLAALRRFNKLVYVGLPDKDSRKGIVQKNLKDIKYDIGNNDMSKVVKQLQGYSASQVTDIVKQACMMPIRQISRNTLEQIDKNKIRAVKLQDFMKVLKVRKPLLSKQDLKKYEGKFNK